MRPALIVAALLGILGGSALVASPAWAITTPQPSITVGAAPVGVAFDPTGARGYVAISSTNRIDVIDRATSALLTPITVCSGPMGIGFSPTGARAYVPCYADGAVAVIDPATGATLTTITVGHAPFFIAMSPDGSKAYVPNSASASVSVIDTATDTVTATIPVGLAPVAVAFNPAGTKAYVANGTASPGGNSVSVIDVASSTVSTTIALAGVPYGVAVSPDNTAVYVSRINGGKISIIDPATNTVGTTFVLAAGTKPEGVTFSPDGKRVYVPTLANGVTVIDATTQTVLPALASGSGSRIMAFTPDGTAAYVSNNLAGTLSVFAFDNTLPTISGTAPAATIGTPYSFTPTVAGPSVTVSLQSGTLPAGLALVGGVIGGTPTSGGSFPVVLRASNENGFADLPINLVVLPPAYVVSFDSAGGSADPDDQAVASGQPAAAPPAPTRAGYAFDGWWNGGSRWDFDSDVATAPVSLTAHWLLLPTIAGAASADAQVDAAFSWTPTITAVAGYSVTSTTLPAGLTLDPATGIISGTPTGPVGATPITLTVTDANGTATFEVAITLTAASVVLGVTGGTLALWLVPWGLSALAVGIGLLVFHTRRGRLRV